MTAYRHSLERLRQLTASQDRAWQWLSWSLALGPAIAYVLLSGIRQASQEIAFSLLVCGAVLSPILVGLLRWRGVRAVERRRNELIERARTASNPELAMPDAVESWPNKEAKALTAAASASKPGDSESL